MGIFGSGSCWTETEQNQVLKMVEASPGDPYQLTALYVNWAARAAPFLFVQRCISGGAHARAARIVLSLAPQAIILATSIVTIVPAPRSRRAVRCHYPDNPDSQRRPAAPLERSPISAFFRTCGPLRARPRVSPRPRCNYLYNPDSQHHPGKHERAASGEQPGLRRASRVLRVTRKVRASRAHTNYLLPRGMSKWLLCRYYLGLVRMCRMTVQHPSSSEPFEASNPSGSSNSTRAGDVGSKGQGEPK